MGDQELELQEPPRFDIDEPLIIKSNEEINEVYQIPVSQIPDFQIEIKNGEIAEEGILYSTSRLIPRGEGELTFPPVLHKYVDIEWNVVQSILKKCETSCFPNWHHKVTIMKKRLFDIFDAPNIELYRDNENQYARIKQIETSFSETMVSKDEITQFKKNLNQQPTNESVLEKRIRDAMNDVTPSGIQKEAERDYQDLTIQVDNAIRDCEFFVSPPRSSVNMIFNDNIEDRNNHFIEFGVVYRANIILRHIISLAKYTKMKINFFGLNNEKYKIALGDARDVVQRLQMQKGVERIYSLYDLIGITRIILPGKKSVFQKKILEPSTPSPELRTTQETLQSAGSGQT